MQSGTINVQRSRGFPEITRCHNGTHELVLSLLFIVGMIRRLLQLELAYISRKSTTPSPEPHR
jgi:hypothetical protein